MLIINAGARAFSSARFGQGTGPIALDDVQCNTSSDRQLLECPNWGFYVENCGHSEDAGVSCILNRVDGTLSATPWPVNVLNTTYSAIVLLTWEQSSVAGDRPSSFRAECKSQFHSSSMTLSNMNDQSFTTPLGGLLPSTSYNCCVSAVYDTMHMSEGACMLVETTQPSETESVATSFFPNSGMQPLVIGGVLGFVIIVLLILLAIMGTCMLRLRANSKTDER